MVTFEIHVLWNNFFLDTLYCGLKAETFAQHQKTQHDQLCYGTVLCLQPFHEAFD